MKGHLQVYLNAELKLFRNNPDTRGLLLVMFTVRINSGESEKPAGWDCQPTTVMEVLMRPWLEWLPQTPSCDTWELVLAPWVNTLAGPIKAFRWLPEQMSNFHRNALVQLEIRIQEIPFQDL